MCPFFVFYIFKTFFTFPGDVKSLLHVLRSASCDTWSGTHIELCCTASYKILRVHTRPFVEITPKCVANTGCALSVIVYISFLIVHPQQRHKMLTFVEKFTLRHLSRDALFSFSRSFAGEIDFLTPSSLLKPHALSRSSKDFWRCNSN